MDIGFAGRISDGVLTYSGCAVELRGHLNLTVLADGFLSNVEELRESAFRRGENAATSLVDWIAKAYRWWGSHLSRHVLGQFAAAVIDHSNGSLILLQDTFGISQLFYGQTADGIVFACRLIDVVSLLRPSGLDLEYFADMLACGMPASDRTPYPGVVRVRRGASVIWREGRIETARPWKPPESVIHSVTEHEYEAELSARLSVAVERCIRPDDRVWCELSGGLDSTSVLVVGLRQGHRLEAVTFTDEDDGGDSGIAASVVAQLKVPWHTLEARETPPFLSIPSDFLAEPGTEILCARQAAYQSLLRENGVNVVLTGVGGDVTFGSPDCLPHHLADPLYRGHLRLLWRSLHEWQRGDASHRSLLFWFTRYSLRTSARHLFRMQLNAPDWWGRLPTWISRNFARRYRLGARARAQDAPRHPNPGRHALWSEVYGQAAALGVGAMRKSGVQMRHPLLDRSLVEFMLSLPYGQRQLSDCDRHLQRRALRGVLPECVLERHGKGGGQRTFDAGFRVSAAWREILTKNPRIVAAEFVDSDAWLKEVGRARFGLYESLRHFVTAACIECWLRRLDLGFPDPVAQLGTRVPLKA